MILLIKSLMMLITLALRKKKITLIKFGLDEEMWKVKQFMVTLLIATAIRER